MVDVASMSQFLLMTSDLLAVVRKAGGDLSHDFIKYVVTRHEPFDGPQSQIVALLRSLFSTTCSRPRFEIDGDLGCRSFQTDPL